jgi:hypothetical protein
MFIINMFIDDRLNSSERSNNVHVKGAKIDYNLPRLLTNQIIYLYFTRFCYENGDNLKLSKRLRNTPFWIQW